MISRAGKSWRPPTSASERWSDAADAYANVLRLAPPTADAIADYGEMLVFANEGMVTAEAERRLRRGLEARCKESERARFYHDMALKQEGKAEAPP